MDDLITQLRRNSEALASGITPPGIGSDPTHFLTGQAAAKLESNAKVIAALREVLKTVKLYIADQVIAHAIVVPADAAPNEKGRFNPEFPSLMQVIIKALAATDEQTAGK